MSERPDFATLLCSFCGKGRKDVHALVAGPAKSGVAICDECINFCGDIVREEQDRKAITAAKEDGNG